MKRECRRWTESEDKFILTRYKELGAQATADYLCRTKGAVHSRAQKIGAAVPSAPWLLMEEDSTQLVRCGERVGMWEILRKVVISGGRPGYVCRCDCGTEKGVAASHLRARQSLSCGCVSNKLVSMVGEKFNMLTVLERSAPPRLFKFKTHMYKCLCDCGNTAVVRGASLRSGNIKSCGCLKGASKLDPLTTQKALFSRYAKNAKDRGIRFDLTWGEVLSLTQSNCFYCNSAPSNTLRTNSRNKDLKYSGIDRMDSNIHYTPTNVVPCCWVCNRAKNSMNFAEFLDWAHRIARHQQWTGGSEKPCA